MRANASTSASAAASRSACLRATIAACASDCTMPATSRARRNRQYAFCGSQHRVAVEVGDHEAPVAAQHLTDVQVAVPFDDRRARERAETGQHVFDLGMRARSVAATSATA